MTTATKTTKRRARASLTPDRVVPAASNTVARGRRMSDDHGAIASRDTLHAGEGQGQRDNHESDALPSPSNAGGDQGTDGTQTSLVAPGLILALRQLHVERRFAIDMQKRVNQNTLAMIRQSLGFHTGIADDDDRKALCEAASAIVNAIEKSQPCDHPDVAVIATPFVLAAKQAREPYDARRKHVEKEIAQIVRTLPVWPWCESIRGFAEGSVGCIIGEAGDLSNYANPGKLWKRFGLAPHNGKAASLWRLKGGLSADEWTELGYVPRRNSTMYVIGDALVKSNRDGEYRTLYLERKAYELARDPDMKPFIAHRRAQRYMVKRLLRNLWRAWRDA